MTTVSLTSYLVALGQEAGRDPITGAATHVDFKPDTVLQHAGYYYYMAAKCTQERLNRFHAIMEQEVWD